MLHITNGGRMINQGLTFIGGSQNSTGMVTVDGAESTWLSTGTAGNEVNVGYQGDGTVVITDGGDFVIQCTLCTSESTVRLRIGALSGSAGNVIVDGTGSLLRLHGGIGNAFLTVGLSGNGTFSVSNGGTVESTGSLSVWEFGVLNISTGAQIINHGGAVGTTTIGTAQATVDGPGSIWNSNASLAVGGTLTVTNGERFKQQP